MKIITELFYQLLLSSAAAAVLACLILLLKRIFRSRMEAKWHYCIWFLLVIKLLVPYAPESNLSMFNAISPVIKQVPAIENFYSVHENTSIFDVQNISKVQSENETPKVKEISNTENTVSAGNAPDDIKVQDSAGNENIYQKVLHILFFIWLTGFILLIGFTIYGNIKFRKKINSITLCTDKRVNEILDKCIENAGVKRHIPIFQTMQARAPLLYGLIKPKILISTGFMENFSEDELKYVLLHELSHYKRKDILTNWIITVLQLIHWFNPMVWYSFYIMRQDCEIACDAQVLSCLEEAERNKYGQTIINLLKVFTESYFIPSTAGLVKSKSGLKRRITMISIFKKKSWLSALGAVVLIAAVAIVGLPNAKLLANSDEVIHFKDSNIQSAIEESLGKPAGSIIKKSDVQKVKELSIKKVSYAADIGYCTNLESLRLNTPIDFKLLGNIKRLKSLDLYYNVSDLKDIKYCKNLENLRVTEFAAGDTSAFSTLSGLKELSIGFKVKNTDISGLKGLKQLNTLGLGSLKGNSDINELGSLKQLKNLALSDCTDLENIDSLSSLSYIYIRGNTKLIGKSTSSLAQLKNLRELFIEEVAIKDLKPLGKLTDLDSLTMMNTYIRDISPLKNLTKLTHLNLAGNKISDISAVANMEKLKYIELEVNKIENIEPLSNLKEVETLYLNQNRISNINGLSGLTNLKKLNLGENKIVNISPLSGLVNLKDIVLRQNQIETIGKLYGLKNIETIDLSLNLISNVSGLSGLTSLKKADLYDNKIVDISPLAGLANLTELNISNNQIKDLKPFSELHKIKKLSVNGNRISDISSLESMKELTRIEASENQISDITALAGLSKLEAIGLGDNIINENDMAVLAGLTKLKFLGLENNNISDVSFLKSLVNIDCLNLRKNHISDIKTLAGMKKLKYLYLQDNQISDITVLGKLANLEIVNLGNNKITDVRPFAGMSKMMKGGLTLRGNSIKDYSPISSFYNPADDKDY